MFALTHVGIWNLPISARDSQIDWVGPFKINRGIKTPRRNGIPVALHGAKEFGIAFSLSLRAKGRSESEAQHPASARVRDAEQAVGRGTSENPSSGNADIAANNQRRSNGAQGDFLRVCCRRNDKVVTSNV